MDSALVSRAGNRRGKKGALGVGPVCVRGWVGERVGGWVGDKGGKEEIGHKGEKGKGQSRKGGGCHKNQPQWRMKRRLPKL